MIHLHRTGLSLLITAIPLLVMALSASVRADEGVPIGKDRLWNAPRPEGPDLSVQFIRRTPHHPGLAPEYVRIDDAVNGQGETGPVRLKNAGVRKHPQPGEEVTFTVLVRNVGTKPVPSFDWHWLYDGVDADEGITVEPLLPSAELTFIHRRPWQTGRHHIAFQVDRDRFVTEVCEENNWVVDATDACSMAFFVEKRVREWFTRHRNGLGSYDWTDWAQFQIRQMNKEFRDTIYPSCPAGIEERVRLDSVYVIPDGWGHKQGMHTPGVKVPVNVDDPEFYDANAAPAETLEVFNNVIGGVDGVWGFSEELVLPDPNKGGKNFYEFMPRWLTGSEWPLHHELGHQLGRIDNYLIWSDPKDNPANPGRAYQPPEDFRAGMMHSGNYAHDDAIGRNRKKWDSTYRFYSELTARSFNRDLGTRRGLFGEYLFDVPGRNRFVFLDDGLNPVKDAKVEIFPGRGRGYTGCGFNERPAFIGSTDGAGHFTLDRSPWNHVFIWGNNGVVQFKVTPKDEAPLTGFLTIADFNLAFWRGHGKSATYRVKVTNLPGER